MNNHLDFFVWTYKDLKGIPFHIPQQHIKLDTMIPNAHYIKYHMNPHCVIVIKHDFNELFVARFIKLVDQTTWLSRIVVMPKKNGRLHICIDFHKLNATNKKDPYPILFMEEMLYAKMGHENYSFLDGFFRYHQIVITLEYHHEMMFIMIGALLYGWPCPLDSRMYHLPFNV